MKAVVWQRRRRVRVEDVAEPDLTGPQDVIVRVTSAPVCGSDLLMYGGRLPIERGDILGHAAVGVVDEVGLDVEHVEREDRVIVAFDAGCARPMGTQAELMRAAGPQVVRVPPERPDDTYLFLSEVIPAAWQAAQDPGRCVAVFGLGPAGQMCVRTARLRGAERVFGVDAEPARLEMAQRHGAETVNLGLEHDAVAAIRDRTSGRGVDTAIDCVGMAGKRVIEDAKSVARRVSVVGTYPARPPARDIRRWAEELLPMAMRGDDPFGLNDFVTHRVSMAEAPYVYELLRLRKDGAVAVVFEP